jgi:hypothetical protein
VWGCGGIMMKKKYNSEGRPRKNRSCLLGGIPMVVKNGKVTYAWKQSINRTWRDKDSEELEMEQATLPLESDNFVRRHIYEMRFDIEDEDDDERRKREYKEWIEKVI